MNQAKGQLPRQANDGPRNQGAGDSFVVTPGVPGATPATISITQTSSQSYAGPIPPPDMMIGYESIYPGAAELIFKNFDAQSKHRQLMELRQQSQNNLRSWGGLASGTFIVSLAFGLAGYSIYQGQSIAGLATVISALAILAGVFVYGKKSQLEDFSKKKELIAKRKR